MSRETRLARSVFSLEKEHEEWLGSKQSVKVLVGRLDVDWIPVYTIVNTVNGFNKVLGIVNTENPLSAHPKPAS
jgi:hypothetical protein